MSTLEARLTGPAAPAQDQAFREIFLEHYSLVYSLALRVTGRKDTAEDIAQEVFLKFFSLWPRLGIRVSLKSWLARVALNLAYNRVRLERRQLALTERAGSLEPTGAAPSAEELVERDTDRRLVARALGQLRKRDRTVLLLRHSGFSYQEVADATGVRPGSVGKILERSEGRFRRVYLSLHGRND